MSLAHNTLYRGVGVMWGLLPARTQMWAMDEDVEEATLMSEGSRMANMAFGVYAASSIVASLCGIDSEYLLGAASSIAGVVVLGDSMVREMQIGISNLRDHVASDSSRPCGSAVVTGIGALVFPKAYKSHTFAA